MPATPKIAQEIVSGSPTHTLWAGRKIQKVRDVRAWFAWCNGKTKKRGTWEIGVENDLIILRITPNPIL
jgi:hypothetical protein